MPEKQKIILTLDCRGQYGITGKNGEVIHDVDPDLAARMERSGHARISNLWDAAKSETITPSPTRLTTTLVGGQVTDHKTTKSPNKK